MQRYKIKIEYEGTPFVGWQFQKNGQSVQEILQKAIFDFSKDIYGKDIVVSFIEFIRKEKKFDGIDLLKEQISLDSKKAIKILDK